MDLNGWNLVIFFEAGGRGPHTAADLQKAFTSHPGCGTGRLVLRHCNPCRSLGHGREKLPFTDSVCLGDLIESLSRAHGDTNHVSLLSLHGLAGRVQGVAQGMLRRLPSAEALDSQHILKGFLELLTGAWVYDGVDAAV